MGVSLSITAFPVLARILAELKLLTTQVGETAMAAAAFNDIAAWILLALAVALAGGSHKSPLLSLWVLMSGVGFVIFMVVAVRPAMEWVASRCSKPGHHDHVEEGFICLTLAGVMISGFMTDLIGIHSIFGAFVFGLMIPKHGEFAGTLIRRIEDFVCGLLLPLLKLIDYKYRSYFSGDDEDDFADNTRKRKRKEKVVGAPEEHDWEKARQFIEYLRVFYNVTNLISGSKYVTSNLFFGELVTMHASISRMCVDEDEKKQAMAASMKDKYDKYWDNINTINFLLYVAVLLDPRNKLFYLDYCLGQIYGMNSDKTKAMSMKVVETLNELFQHYKMKEDRLNARNKKNSAISTSDSSLFTSGAKVSLETSFLKSTPTDIGLQDMSVSALEELQEKMEKIELDEFPTGQKSFESCMDED
ncbi:hypothetical protein CTI12_AA601430 [Artemisia annua]|uniref:Uncharacterized protein n=1 Tax=Artemisia annua TaxID=35608 RepID=A0A2U1KHS8_ARTAN|nr:hypothetical protein CTI12_AA601430 [Artemisia annua]